jgi:hypothetical protein
VTVPPVTIQSASGSRLSLNRSSTDGFSAGVGVGVAGGLVAVGRGVVDVALAEVVGRADGSGPTLGLGIGPLSRIAVDGSGLVWGAVAVAAACGVGDALGTPGAEQAPTMRAAPAMASLIRMRTTTTSRYRSGPLGRALERTDAPIPYAYAVAACPQGGRPERRRWSGRIRTPASR